MLHPYPRGLDRCYTLTLLWTFSHPNTVVDIFYILTLWVFGCFILTLSYTCATSYQKETDTGLDKWCYIPTLGRTSATS
jgi:hypothetical protein